MRAVAVPLVLLAALLGQAAPAAALSCAARDPQDAVRDGWVIVDGVVEAESFLGIRVHVERVYLGSAERTITVLGGQSGDAHRVGTRWTLYLQRSPVAYHDADCRGSHPESLSAREQAVFGSGRPPVEDQPFLGWIGNGLAAAVIAALWIRRRPRGPSPATATPA